jgi:hypothetical protein
MGLPPYPIPQIYLTSGSGVRGTLVAIRVRKVQIVFALYSILVEPHVRHARDI